MRHSIVAASGQVILILALICAGFLVGLLFPGKPAYCVTQPPAPAPKPTATILELRTGNGHAIP